MTAQSLEALDRANEVRFAHAELKREIRSGAITAADALWDERALDGCLQVEKLVQAIPYVAGWWSSRLLGRLRIPPGKPCADLTKRQRFLLGIHLDRRQRGR